MRIQEALLAGRKELQNSSMTGALDTELLLAHVLGLSKAGLIARLYDELTEDDVARFKELIKRRKAKEPIAYLIGTQEFYGRSFAVSPDVLIPRPETEHLVDLIVTQSYPKDSHLRILDLGTGSACISVSVAAELIHRSYTCSILAIDASEAALVLAEENARMHKVDECIEFRKSDWFEALYDDEVFDVIVSNPPYVERGSAGCSEELAYEPELALYHPLDILGSYREIAARCHQYLSPGGRLFVEHGQGQSEAVSSIFLSAPIGKEVFTSGIIHDLAGIDRIFFLERS